LESYGMFKTNIAICEASPCYSKQKRAPSRSLGKTIETGPRRTIQMKPH
jgi:hypothetical protein